MQEFLVAIRDTPLPTILVLAGIFFILLSVVNSISGNIQVEPSRRRAAFYVGVVLACVGVFLYVGSTLKDVWKPASKISFDKDLDRPGGDYKPIAMASPDPPSCQRQCLDDPQCLAFAYVPPKIQGPTAVCYLKNSKPPVKQSVGWFSGVREP